MGDICCQTTTITSPLQPTLKITDYQQTTLPQNDLSFNNWLKQNNIQLKNNQPSQEGNPPSPTQTKPMKNKQTNQYYFGQWANGLSQGQGILYQPDKFYFKGNFHSGIPQGKATIKFLQLSYDFLGQLKDGKAHGQGQINNFKQHYQFKGTWQDSKPKQGVLTFTNGDIIENIQFKDYPNGQGIINYTDKRVYDGKINTAKFVPDGYGKVSFQQNPNSKKSQYIGQMKDGIMDGHGKLIMKDGSQYDGQYKQGKKQGQGKFTYKTKQYYIGSWKNGKQNGDGILYDVQGNQIKKGQWIDGRFKQQENPSRKIPLVQSNMQIKQTQNQHHEQNPYPQINQSQQKPYLQSPQPEHDQQQNDQQHKNSSYKDSNF